MAAKSRGDLRRQRCSRLEGIIANTAIKQRLDGKSYYRWLRKNGLGTPEWWTELHSRTVSMAFPHRAQLPSLNVAQFFNICKVWRAHWGQSDDHHKGVIYEWRSPPIFLLLVPRLPFMQPESVFLFGSQITLMINTTGNQTTDDFHSYHH